VKSRFYTFQGAAQNKYTIGDSEIWKMRMMQDKEKMLLALYHNFGRLFKIYMFEQCNSVAI
jgi:hypothetical protein